MYRPNEQQRAGYIAASERCVGTAAGLPIPAAAQSPIGTEPARRGATETNSGYAPQQSGSWLVQAAARRGRAAVSAAPERPFLRSGFGVLCIVPQPKQGLGADDLARGLRVQADAGDFRIPASPFPRAGAFGVRPLDAFARLRYRAVLWDAACLRLFVYRRGVPRVRAPRRL